MLWIALAIGGVLGTVVFLLIELYSWSTSRIHHRQQSVEASRPGNQVVASDRGVPEVEHRRAALLVVEAISQQMGALRTDVVWTITNSALWDIAVPESRRFFTALTVWQDHHATWGTEEVVQRAGELKVLWNAALDSALRLGIQHLSPDDRPAADIAIKLVRKAASTGSDAERHALMAKAAQVLSGIMSITIPRETMRAIERGGTPPALPGAHDDPGGPSPLP